GAIGRPGIAIQMMAKCVSLALGFIACLLLCTIGLQLSFQLIQHVVELGLKAVKAPEVMAAVVAKDVVLILPARRKALLRAAALGAFGTRLGMHGLSPYLLRMTCVSQALKNMALSC